MQNSSPNKINYGDFLKERKRTRLFFNLVSIIYPLIERHLFPEYQEAIKKLDLPAGLTVLDVATGSGILAAAFGPRVPYLIAAGAAAIVVVLTWFTLEETVTPEQQEARRTGSRSTIQFSQLIRNTPLLLILRHLPS